MVTHQVHHLSSNVSEILYLADGEIKFRGNFTELIASGVNMEMIEEQGNEDARSNRSRRQSRVENQINQENSFNESIDAKFLNSSHFSDLNSSSLMLNVSYLETKKN